MRPHLLLSCPLALGALAGACTHSYDEFEFRDSTSGGKGGAAQGGSSGKAGSSGAATGGSAGAAGSSGSGGTAQGGTGGGKGDGGPAGSGTGGSAGSSNCPQYQIQCQGSCVPGTERARCGGCTNDCSQQGASGGFQCIDMRCGCQSSQQCGSGPSTRCALTVGRCVCGSTQCQAGESCNNGACSCNGGAACSRGQTCCLSGCAASC